MPPLPPQRPRCTPPGTPRIPNIPVCRPLVRGVGGVTPFGGPASGISTAGGVPTAAEAAVPGVIVTPTPPPVPTCYTASIFADCFESCVGVINGAAPGPICGWTFIEPFGALGGLFTFTPGVMSMDTLDANDFPTASKSLPDSLASVFGLSGQWDFTEYQTPPNASTAYQTFINNSGLTQTLSVSLFGDGSVFIQAGATASAPSYSGTWTPNGGAHVVHFQVDGAGVPTLYIDEVLIPLTPLGNIPTFGAAYPANSISYGGGAAVAAPAASPLRSLFVTAGIVGPETEFCCV